MDNFRTKCTNMVALSAASIWVVLQPIQGLLYAIGTLLAIDFITGVIKSVAPRNGKRQPITSRGFRATFSKTAVYFLVMVAGFACDYIMANIDPTVTRAFALTIALTEGISISENFEAITGINILRALFSILKPAELAIEQKALEAQQQAAQLQQTQTTVQTATQVVTTVAPIESPKQ